VLSEKILEYIRNLKGYQILPVKYDLIEDRIMEGWDLFPIVKNFYELYGGIHVPDFLDIQAYVGNGKLFSKRLRSWMNVMQIKLFPFASNTFTFYLIADNGAIYTTNNEASGMFNLGDTINDGFNSILWPQDEYPDNFQDERTTFWTPDSTFPPPFIREVFVKNPQGSRKRGHWKIVYPPLLATESTD
jgi:hypothetical protein